jgi:hypothetical protein
MKLLSIHYIPPRSIKSTAKLNTCLDSNQIQDHQLLILDMATRQNENKFYLVHRWIRWNPGIFIPASILDEGEKYNPKSLYGQGSVISAPFYPYINLYCILMFFLLKKKKFKIISCLVQKKKFKAHFKNN